jgi:hypothetical protein
MSMLIMLGDHAGTDGYSWLDESKVNSAPVRFCTIVTPSKLSWSWHYLVHATDHNHEHRGRITTPVFIGNYM